MSIIKVKEYLRKYNMEDRIMEFTTSGATVEEASQTIGCTQKEVAKTLSFLVGEKKIIIVVAGDARIDNAKYKSYFGKKAKMVPHDEVEALIGHQVGGVCPFGVNDDVEIYLDKTLKANKFVYPACGNCNSAIKLSLEEFEKIVKYKDWIDVCKEYND